ncbi:MAG: ABC transporter permease [Clostridia bacterium]
MNSMMTMGLVTCPDDDRPLMSGVFPLTAIKYQIAIMLNFRMHLFRWYFAVPLGYRFFTNRGFKNRA